MSNSNFGLMPVYQEFGLNGLVLSLNTTKAEPVIPARHKYNSTVTSYLSAPLSGLGGQSINLKGVISGAVFGLALNYIFDLGNWQIATSIGAITGGIVLS